MGIPDNSFSTIQVRVEVDTMPYRERNIFQQFDRAVARAAFEKLDAEMMALYRDAHRLYLLPPPALRPGCPAGNICAEETFHTLDGFPVSIFVPEAGCPVHDSEDWENVKT